MYRFVKYLLFCLLFGGITLVSGLNCIFAEDNSPQVPPLNTINASPETKFSKSSCPDGSIPFVSNNPNICGCANCECLICSTCGDSILANGETCDPIGSTTTGGLCSAECNFCGDGNVNKSFEACDTGIFDPPLTPAQINGNAVCNNATCLVEWCGDLVPNNGEECDGAYAPGYPTAIQGNQPGCDLATCLIRYCGDGKKNGAEECDPTDSLDVNQAICDPDCMIFSLGLNVKKEFRWNGSGGWIEQKTLNTTCNMITTTTTDKYVEAGISVDFRYTVTNTGTMLLQNLKLTDLISGNATPFYAPALFDLAPGASRQFNFSSAFTKGLHLNTVTVDDQNAPPPILGVSDTDNATFCVIDCGDGILTPGTSDNELCDGTDFGTAAGVQTTMPVGVTGCSPTCQPIYRTGLTVVKRATSSGVTNSNSTITPTVTATTSCTGSTLETYITQKDTFTAKQIVDFSYLVTNTGGQAVELKTIVDPVLGLNVTLPAPGPLLAANGGTYTYTVPAANRLTPTTPGTLHANTVTVTGTDLSNTNVSATDTFRICTAGCGDGIVTTGTSDNELCDGTDFGTAAGVQSTMPVGVTGCSSTCQPIYTAGLTVVKRATTGGTTNSNSTITPAVTATTSCTGSTLETYITQKDTFTAKQVVDFSYLVTNTGGQAVELKTIVDPVLGLNVTLPAPGPILAANGGTYTYTVPAANRLTPTTPGALHTNTVTVTGTDLSNTNVTATDTFKICTAGCGDGIVTTGTSDNEVCDGTDFSSAAGVQTTLPVGVEKCSSTCQYNFFERVRIRKSINNFTSGNELSSSWKIFRVPSNGIPILDDEYIGRNVYLQEYIPDIAVVNNQVEVNSKVTYEIQNIGKGPFDLESVVDAVIESGGTWPDLAALRPKSLPLRPLAVQETFRFEVESFKFNPYNPELHSSTALVTIRGD